MESGKNGLREGLTKLNETLVGGPGTCSPRYEAMKVCTSIRNARADLAPGGGRSRGGCDRAARRFGDETTKSEMTKSPSVVRAPSPSESAASLGRPLKASDGSA